MPEKVIARFLVGGQRLLDTGSMRVAVQCEIVWDPDKGQYKAFSEGEPQFDVWGDYGNTVALAHFQKRLGL